MSGMINLHGPGREQFPAGMGSATSANSSPVVIASDQAAIPVTTAAAVHSKANAPTTIDYTGGGGVTTAAYTTLVAATTLALKRILINDTGGKFMIIATGAAGVEVDQFYYGPGWFDFVDIDIPAGTRIAIKALDANSTVGRLIASFFT